MSRTAGFEEARFGLFIHWNACAALEGRFCGEPVRQTDYGEWLRARNRVPRADWDEAVRQLHITPEIVEGWAEAAMKAGMKYVIFVTKHHDGLAYWPSKLSDYTLNNMAGVSFDIVQKLKEACGARGLRLGFYYSHWHDWEHPYGWGNFWDLNSDDPAQYAGHEDFFFYGGEGHRDNLTPEHFDVYWREKSMAQVRELIERYQPASFWFDCWRRLEDTNMTRTQVEDMLAMIRELDPAIVVNSRLGMMDGVDYETLGDNEFPASSIDHPWESAVTFALSWGYSRDDQNWRPASYFIRNLARNISLGGNLVINFGPRADGTPPRESLLCMEEIGRCLAANGQGFYGCGISTFAERTQDWGLTTVAGNSLFLHVFDWPVDGVIRVNGLLTEVLRVDGYEFEQIGQSVRVFGPRTMPIEHDTVIRLDLASPPEADNETIGEINGGGIAMQASRATVIGVEKQAPVPGSTKLPLQLGGWTPGGTAFWRIWIHEPGEYEVKVCYACNVEIAGKPFTVSTGTASVEGTTKHTHANWSDFRPFAIGKLHLDRGFQTVTVSAPDDLSGELLKLLWVFVGGANSKVPLGLYDALRQ